MTFQSKRSQNPSSKKSLRAKKGLGQNFLVDRNVIGRIIDACSFSKDDDVLEIGPGTGALTREIIPKVRSLIAVETDRELVEHLQAEFSNEQVKIIHADFLKYDLPEITGKGKRFKIVGNLPYYISTPIMAKVIENRHLFTEFYLTVQQEFAERIVASPGGKDYSSFSCFNQYYTIAKILFKIKSSAFKPVPKVDSCFLRMAMRPEPAFPCADEKFLFNVIRLGFGQRRKTLVNALSTLLSKDRLIAILHSAGLHANVRAEEVSLEQYTILSGLIRKSSSPSV